MDVREITLIRHAPGRTGGTLAGRTDPACDRDAAKRVAPELRRQLPDFGARTGDRLLISPARRCVETAAILFPVEAVPPAMRSTDERLWEQDFGEWEGMPYADLPDPGLVGRSGIASHRPPGGESFLQMADRVIPAVLEAAGKAKRLVIVAHAGTVRAVLGHVLGNPAAGIAFSVEPLSLTRLGLAAGAAMTDWGIAGVNQTFPRQP